MSNEIKSLDMAKGKSRTVVEAKWGRTVTQTLHIEDGGLTMDAIRRYNLASIRRQEQQMVAILTNQPVQYEDDKVEKLVISSEALALIKENLGLSDQYRDKSVIDMVNHQEKLINKFVALGYSREDFFTAAREQAGVE